MKRIDLQKPVMEIYEESDWVRVVVPGYKDRFLKQHLAQDVLRMIGYLAVSEKSEIIVREKEMVLYER